VQHADSILGLLSYIPMQPFQKAYAAFLQPAERALIEASRSSETYDLLLGLYTALFRRWAVQTPRASAPPRRGLVFAHADQLAFSELVAHVDQISISLLLSLPSADVVLTSAILTFYEVVSASSIPDRVPIVLPPTHLIYLLSVASSTTELSRIAGIIAAFKRAFDKHPRHLKDYYPEQIIDNFNVCIRDIYHLIWISRALSVGKDEQGRHTALGMFCDPSLRESLNTYLGGIDHKYAIQTSFGISHNVYLASLSAAAWRELEESEIQRKGYDRRSIKWHEGPVSQRSLEVLRRNGGVDVDWEAYRVHVLKWLDARGCGGLKEFLFASVKATREKYADGA
jgi:centromere protein I